MSNNKSSNPAPSAGTLFSAQSSSRRSAQLTGSLPRSLALSLLRRARKKLVDKEFEISHRQAQSAVDQDVNNELNKGGIHSDIDSAYLSLISEELKRHMDGRTDLHRDMEVTKMFNTFLSKQVNDSRAAENINIKLKDILGKQRQKLLMRAMKANEEAKARAAEIESRSPKNHKLRNRVKALMPFLVRPRKSVVGNSQQGPASSLSPSSPAAAGPAKVIMASRRGDGGVVAAAASTTLAATRRGTAAWIEGGGNFGHGANFVGKRRPSRPAGVAARRASHRGNL